MPTQLEKAERFRALHAEGTAFVVPNPWDAGSARILAGSGFKALATTSRGLCNSLARGDGVAQVTQRETIENCRAIAAATDLPVTADLENCFADDPKQAALTIRLAAEAGVVGGSIEDATGDPARPLYDLAHAVERVHAAVEVARTLPFPFVLTARTETLFRGGGDLEKAIRRLRAFEAAGADVLYATSLKDLVAVRTVTASVRKPVNVAVSLLGPQVTVADLAAAGVTRISLAGTLSHVALTGLVRAAQEIARHGTFTFLGNVLSTRQIVSYFD